MAKAFLLTSTHGESVTVEQFHVNLWLFSYSKAFLDIGLLLNLEKDLVSGESRVELCHYAPFSIKGNSLVDLCDRLQHEDTLELIFNDELESITNIASVPTVGVAHLIRFRSGRAFVVPKPIVHSQGRPSRLGVVIDLNSMDRERLVAEFADDEFVRAYVRLRYEVDIKGSPNIYFDQRVGRDRLHFDFRFNEPRLFESDEPDIGRSLVPIREVLVFSIQPSYLGIVLEPTAHRKYVRVLEKERSGWREYMDEIEGKKENFLVYHWRAILGAPGSAESHFDMLVSFDAERADPWRRLNAALALGLISSMSLLLLQNVNVGALAGRLVPVLRGTAQAIGGAGLVLGSRIIANAMYDWLKGFFRSRRHQEVNTNTRASRQR